MVESVTIKKGKQRYPRVSYAHFTLNRMVQVGTKDSFGIPAGKSRVHTRPPSITSTRKKELGSKGFGERLEHCRQRRDRFYQRINGPLNLVFFGQV